jgi:serine/threonine-protein kinase
LPRQGGEVVKLASERSPSAASEGGEAARRGSGSSVLVAVPPAREPTPVAAPALTWETKVFDQPNGGFRLARATDVSRGGMFLQTEGTLPSMFSRLRVALLLPDGDFPLSAEVVRHVTKEQSKSWNMPVGFGVQFIELTPAQRDDLSNLVKGVPRWAASAGRAEEKDDPKADQALAQLRRRLTTNHYELLGLPEDIDFSEIRQKGRDVKKALAELRTRPVSAKQRAELEALDKRIDEAMTAIGQPKNRLEYDAGRANWRGVAKSISGGVSVTDLDQARRRYLSTHDRVEGAAHLHFTTGNAWESQRDFTRAQAEFERALGLDPLNLAYHQRYQALRRMLTTPGSGAKKP